MAEAEKVGYLITVNKQTAMTGEFIQIQTNLPFGSTEDVIAAELSKITHAMDARRDEVNDKVLAKTGKTLKELGLEVPGFNGK